MTKDEIDGYLEQQGERVDSPMMSRVWRCGRCKKDHVSDMPVKPPAPCSCGSIWFTRMVALPH